MFGLQPTLENYVPSPGLLERYSENIHNDAAITEIAPRLRRGKEDAEERPEEDSPDEKRGCYIDRSLQDGGRERLQELREERKQKLRPFSTG
jgi:hypothetical protein